MRFQLVRSPVCRPLVSRCEFTVSRVCSRVGFTKEELMDSNPSGGDPRKIWQGQPREPSKITMVLIRQRAQDLHAKTRRTLINSVISHAAAFLGCIVGTVLTTSSGQRIAYAVGAIYAVAGATIIHRGMWTQPM